MDSLPTTANSGRAIVFIDSRVPDIHVLIAAVQPGVRVVVLDANENGVAQMARALEGEQGLASISIISHGSEGALQLGNGTLNADNLAQHQTALEALGAALQPDGDILLYGCDVASGDEGQAFIAQLAQATQADVAASTNRTGAASLGADWVLEARVGEVQNDLALNVADVAGYSHTLAPANQSFDAQAAWSRLQLPGSAGETIDGMIYSIGRTGNSPILSDNISLDEFGMGISSLPGDQALRFLSHMFGSGSYASIKSADGAEFRMVSMEVENAFGGDLKFAGYRNGEEVATGQFDPYLPLYTNESLSYVRNELQGGSYGTVNFASSWYNVDEIRISIPNFPILQIAIDDLVFANAVLPGPQLVSTTFSQDAFKIGDTATVTFTFASAVEGFELADITVPNGKLTNLDTSNGGITWTATLTPDAGVTDSSNVLTVDLAGVVSKSDNLAGVGSVESPNFAVDTQRPEAILIELVDTQLAIGETTTLNIVFNEAVSGLAIQDLEVAGGNLSNLASNDNILWTATFTPTAGITQVGNKITLDLSGVTDSAGNAGQGTRDSNSYAVDTQRPTAEITIADTALAAGQTSLVTVVFSEAVTGFGNANLTAPNGTLSTPESADGGKTWTATFTPTAGLKDATNVMTLDYTGVTDLAGNPATGTTNSDNYTIDTQAPTATVVVADTALAAGETSLVTITFNEAVTGFGNASLTLGNGTLSTLESSDQGITWTATFTPTAGVTSAENLITLNYNGIQSVASGNAATGSKDSNSYAIDTQRPDAILIELVDTQLAIGETTTLNIVFNEAVSGLAIQDLEVAGGNLSNLASNDNILWTATFTPTAGITQVGNKITLDLSGVTDSAGNAGQGTRDSNSYAVDTQRPTAEITIADTALAAGQTSLVTVVFSEAVTGFGNANLTAPNGTLSTPESADGGKTWTATFTPTAGLKDATNVMTLDYTGVTDLAGNPATGTTNSDNYTIDTQAPTATVVVADTALAAGETSLVTITFNEAVTGFGNASLTLGNGTLSTLESSDQGITWTATFTPTAGVTSAENLITLNYNGIESKASGNAATGSKDSNSYAIDTQRPKATIELDDSELAIGETAQVSIVFTEAVTDFALEDLSAAQGELSGLTTSDNITWTATFTPTAGVTQGGNQITLNLSGVKDLAGNAGQDTVDSGTYAIDTAAPVFISAAVNGRTLVLSYAESGTLDGVNIPAAQDFDVRVGAAANAVTAVSVDAVAKTVTLTLATAIVHGNVVTLTYNDPTSENDLGAIQDAAGNDAASLVAVTVTNNTPAIVPPTPTLPTVPTAPSAPVDGVPVVTKPGVDGSTIITVPVILPNRPDTPGTPSTLADIPLFKGADGHSILLASLPTGVGLQVEGLASPLTANAALAELIQRVEQVAGNNAALSQAAQTFHDSIAPNESLVVQVVKPIKGAGYDASIPLVITGSTSAIDGKQAIVFDGRALPAGASIQLNNVDFAAIVGAVQVTGGAGRNVVSGDGAAQYIVLGPEDDIIHGGGGNDTVGSKGGDDQLYGDAGDDIVFGGAGNDILSGGSGSDRLNGGTGFDVALLEGKRSDYSITLDGQGIKLTHIASEVADWLVDVEQVRFATGPSLTVAHSEAEETAAFLFRQRMEREPTPSEGAVIQTLDGLSAQQVAELFALVYPQQAAGKTPAQLLEGMESAGAIRVDAERAAAFVGDAGNNTITPTLGLAWSVDGGGGIDTLVFPATLAQTHIEASAAGFTLQRMTDGAMLELVNVERLAFSDTQLALDLDGHAGQAAKLLGALGGAVFLANKPLVGEVIRALDAGTSAQDLAQLGLQLLGAQSPGQITQLLWTNVVGSAATPAQLQPFVEMMAQGVTGGELAVLASNLELNATRIDLMGLSATGIEFA